MNKLKKLISIFLLATILFSNFSGVFAKTIAESDKINLKFDHDCISVLKIKVMYLVHGSYFLEVLSPKSLHFQNIVI